jgi:hypothetical protein
LGPHLDAAWALSTTVSSALASFRLPAKTSTACVGFDLVAASVPGAKVLGWWAQYDSESGLIGAGGTTVTLIRDGSVVPLSVSATLATNITAGAVIDGQLWLGTGLGYLLRGRLDGNRLTASFVSAAPEVTAFRWIDGDATTAVTDILALSTTGHLWRFDGQTWTSVATFQAPSGYQQWNGGVLRLSLHRFLAALVSDPRILLVDAQGVTQVPFPSFAFELIESLSDTALGPVAAISSKLYVYRNGTFTALRNDYSATSFLAVVPFRDGAIGVSTDGLIQQYLPTGACPVTASTLGHTGYAILHVGESLVFAGDDLRDLASVELTFARPRK